MIIGTIIVSLLLAAASIALSELLRPKPKLENARPASLGDFKFPTAIEGRVVPIVWGRVKLDGPNVVWWGDFRQTRIREKVKTGLFSSKRVTTGFKYFFGFQMGLCRGTIDAVTRVWVGDTEVFNGTTTSAVVIDSANLFGGEDLGTGGVEGTLRIFVGTELQAQSAYLAPFQDPLPAYRGTCHVVWEGGFIGNTTDIKPWSFEVERFPNQLGLGGGLEIVNSADANPAAVLYEILVDTDFGFGFVAADIDVASFTSVAATLSTEGNGFSLVLDNPLQAVELLREIEQQIDGVVLLDQTTGKFKLVVARGGFDVDLIPQVDSTNIVRVSDFTRGTWDETSNQVRIKFADRARDYFETFSQAHDLANERIQGQVVSAELNYPGVKDTDLANNLASRELKSLSRPKAKATIVVDRSLHELQPLDVVAWTDTNLGFVKLPMRVLRADLGELLSGEIELVLVEDTFTFDPAFFAANPDPLWIRPTQDVLSVPAAQQVLFEAPKAFLDRDEAFPGVLDRVWAAARAQTGSEVTFAIFQRNDPVTPAGAFIESGEVFGFFLIGTLGTTLAAADVNPTATIRLDASPDALSSLLGDFSQSPAASDIGQNLVNLIFIGTEFMAPTRAVDQTTFIDLEVVYRGLLDSTVEQHSAGASVFLLFVAGGLTDDTIARNNVVDVQLRSRSRTDEVSEGAAVTTQISMADRPRRPYVPVELKLNGTRFDNPVSFDTLKPGGTTLDDRGINLTYLRRDFRSPDEVAALLTDAGTLFPDFPTANTTRYQTEVTELPSTVLFTTAFNSGEATIFLSRTKILRETAGAIPVNLRVEVKTEHDFAGESFTAREDLAHNFLLAATSLGDDTNLGVLAQNVISPTYTAPVTATYTFNLGTALATGIVEARINVGGFVTVIAAGLTTGTLAGVTATDTIEVRHTEPSISGETFLEIDAPASTIDAYAILI